MKLIIKGLLFILTVVLLIHCEKEKEDFTGDSGTFEDKRDGHSYNWVRIGEQIWMAENLDIGEVIISTSEQTNNGIIEKYAVNDNYVYCDTFGGLYQWHELMDYTTTESEQGICPDGWHVPSDEEWKILEMELGMTREMADSAYERGTNQGALLKVGGESAFEGLLYAFRNTNGNIGTSPGNAGYYWTSKENTNLKTHAVYRILYSTNPFIGRMSSYKTLGLSVRCIKNSE